MKPSVKYSLVIAMVVIFATVLIMKDPSKDVASHMKDDKQEGARLSTTPVYPKEDGEFVKNSTPVVNKELPGNPYLTKESLVSLPRTMKEFVLLDMKAIRNTEETKIFYSLLRSPAAIEDAQKILLNLKVNDLAGSEREHLTATRFLSRALGDLSNKSNTNLSEIVKNIILKDNLSGSMPVKAKMIFAGDKAELVQTLIAFNQNAHKELLGRTKSSTIKKIVENAHSYNESMRATN